MNGTIGFNVPILLITFNRPDNAQRVFEVIKQIRPSKLYLFSDAPRVGNQDDLIQVKECRKIAEQINWPCKLQTKFETTNLGCGQGVSSAITWAFNSTDKLIILEDDCVPDPSFFSFCEQMLYKYEHDQRVMHISGTRWNDEFEISDSDHFFSIIGHIWGWATWKRAWRFYDYKLVGLNKAIDREMLKKRLRQRTQAQYWYDCFFYVKENNGTKLINTWDYQWQYTLFKHDGLAVVPNVNLISNIGVQGVHTRTGDDEVSYYKPTAKWINSTTLAGKVIPAIEFDRYHIDKHFMRNMKPFKKIQLYLKSFL